MSNHELLQRITDKEDNFVERKLEGVNSSEIRKTVVAFANSVPEGRTGVLFLGIADSGSPRGVMNTDKLQKTIRSVCEEECYPPIVFKSEVLEIDGKSIVAVVIPPSTNGPHFAGPAYVRKGSESVKASPEVFDDLVSMRVDKCRAILKHKGSLVSVIAREKELGSVKRLRDASYLARHECRVEECSPHVLRLYDLTTRKPVSEPLNNITLAHDEERNRLMLIVHEG